MATINIFDKITGDILESYQGVSNLKQWLIENVKNYHDSVRPPYSAELNGRYWPHDRHDRTLIDSDVVSLTIEPQDPTTLFYVLTIASAAYSYYTIKNLPDFQNSASDGQSIYNVQARANTAKPSGVIREVAGQIQIYPDLLSEPKRYYEDQREYALFLLCVGKGYYSISESNFYIGNTQLINYGSDVEINVFEPGESNSGVDSAEVWYTTKEVSGQDLGEFRDITIIGEWTYDIASASITSYFGGSPAEFPFFVGEIFYISTTASPNVLEYLRVDSISGSSNEIAAVTSMVQTVETFFVGSTKILNITFTEAASTSLVTETGAALVLRDAGNSSKIFGPYRATPEGVSSRYHEVDFFFPRGLAAVTDKGNLSSNTVITSIEYREIGTESWTTVSAGNTTFTAATYDQLGYTVEIDTGSSAEYEFRFSKTGAGINQDTLIDDVIVQRLKAKIDSPTSYADITTVGVKLRGDNTLSNNSENKINIRGATRKLPTIAELAANSWDLSDSVTQTSEDYEIIGAEFLNSSGYTNLGYVPQETATKIAVDFSPDGLYMVMTTDNSIKFFRLNTAFRPDLGVFNYNGYYVADRIQTKIRDSGTDIFTYDDDGAGNARILQRLITPAYVADSTASVGSFFSSTELTEHSSFEIDQNAEYFWITDPDTQEVHEYLMSTPNNIGTASYNSVSFDASSQLGDNSADSTKDLNCVVMGDYNGSGQPTRMYLMRADGLIFPYTIVTPGDITTAAYDGSPFTPTLAGTIQNFHVSADYMYIMSVADGIGYVSTYRLPEFTDTRATRSLARFVGYVLRDNMGTEATDRVDWDALSTLDTLLTSRSDWLDFDFSDETTLWEAVKLALIPGYCEPSLREGKFYPIREAAGSSYSHLYTPDIMLADGLQVDADFYDAQEPDGVDVEYFSNATNSMEVVECRLSGDLGLRPKRIQANGITDETRAWRLGMRLRRQIRQKPLNFSFDTEMDALNSEYGDVVAIAGDMFGSQCGELTAYSAPTVTLDFEPDFSAGGTHYAAFRKPNGRYSGLYTVVAGGSANQITLSSPTTLDFTPVVDGTAPSYVAFGPASSWGRPGIIKSIQPNGEDSVSVSAQEYITAIYADDNNSPS